MKMCQTTKRNHPQAYWTKRDFYFLFYFFILFRFLNTFCELCVSTRQRTQKSGQKNTQTYNRKEIDTLLHVNCSSHIGFDALLCFACNLSFWCWVIFDLNRSIVAAVLLLLLIPLVLPYFSSLIAVSPFTHRTCVKCAANQLLCVCGGLYICKYWATYTRSAFQLDSWCCCCCCCWAIDSIVWSTSNNPID